MSKVHNKAPVTKAELRRRLLEFVPCPKVFETHSGPGIMRRAVYSDVEDWVGVDLDPNAPDAIHADSVLVMRAMNISAFNFFDVDAFGSPWQHIWVISQRWTGIPPLGLVWTDGNRKGLSAKHPTPRSSGWSRQLVEATGISLDTPPRKYWGKYKERAPLKIIQAFFPGMTVMQYITGTDNKHKMAYEGVVLK